MSLAYSPQAILFGMNDELKAVFFRQLSTMVNAGLPVGRGVVTASEVGCKQLGLELAKLVENGKPLSEAMASFPNHFERHEVALVKAGEVSGQLDRQLDQLAASAEKSWHMRKQIKSKTLYPIVIAHSAVMLPPLFLLVKDGLDAYLSTVLKVLVPVYIVAICSAVAYRYFRQAGGPRRVFDHLLAKLPYLGEPSIYGARIRFLDVLGSLIEAGFIPSQAIPLAAESCNSFWLQDRVLSTFKRLGKEVPISTVMEQSGGFRSFETGLVLTGEEAGSFVSSIKKAADALRPEYEAQIHRMMVIMPILLLFLVGGIAGYQAYTIMSGIFAPLQNI